MNEPSDPIARVRALVKVEKRRGYIDKNFDGVIDGADVDDVRAYLTALEGTEEARDLLFRLASRSGGYGAGARFRGLLAEMLCSSVVAWASDAKSDWCPWSVGEHGEGDLATIIAAGNWPELFAAKAFSPNDRVRVITRMLNAHEKLPRRLVEVLFARLIYEGGELTVDEVIRIFAAPRLTGWQRLKWFMDLDTSWSPLLGALLLANLEEVWRPLEAQWSFSDEWKREWTNFARLQRNAAARLFAPLRVAIGYECGLVLDEKRLDPTRQAVEEALTELGFVEIDAEAVATFAPQVELWASLRKLARYEAESYRHRTELAGLRPFVSGLAAGAPECWAEALRWILARAGSLGGCAEAVTFELARVGGSVAAALATAERDDVELVRDRARGIKAALLGVEQPTTAVSRHLLSFAARMLDGTPVFPHPLAIRSRTWVSDPALEGAVEDAIRRATAAFALDIPSWGAADEETLAGILLGVLAAELRREQPQLMALVGAAAPAQRGRITLEHKPVPKKTDEPTWQCDIAVLTRSTVPRRLYLESVTLVQVKKSLAAAPERAARVDAWIIDLAQLRTLIEKCQTAVYWLLLAAGQVLVVPARYVRGLATGRDDEAQATITVGYHDVRSVAIPMEQFLLDLVLGAWIGVSDGDTLAFGRGELGRTRPRHILEITVHYDGG